MANIYCIISQDQPNLIELGSDGKLLIRPDILKPFTSFRISEDCDDMCQTRRFCHTVTTCPADGQILDFSWTIADEFGTVVEVISTGTDECLDYFFQQEGNYQVTLTTTVDNGDILSTMPYQVCITPCVCPFVCVEDYSSDSMAFATGFGQILSDEGGPWERKIQYSTDNITWIDTGVGNWIPMNVDLVTGYVDPVTVSWTSSGFSSFAIEPGYYVREVIREVGTTSPEYSDIKQLPSPRVSAIDNFGFIEVTLEDDSDPAVINKNYLSEEDRYALVIKFYDEDYIIKEQWTSPFWRPSTGQQVQIDLAPTNIQQFVNVSDPYTILVNHAALVTAFPGCSIEIDLVISHSYLGEYCGGSCTLVAGTSDTSDLDYLDVGPTECYCDIDSLLVNGTSISVRDSSQFFSDPPVGDDLIVTLINQDNGQEVATWAGGALYDQFQGHLPIQNLVSPAPQRPTNVPVIPGTYEFLIETPLYRGICCSFEVEPWDICDSFVRISYDGYAAVPAFSYQIPVGPELSEILYTLLTLSVSDQIQFFYEGVELVDPNPANVGQVSTGASAQQGVIPFTYNNDNFVEIVVTPNPASGPTDITIFDYTIGCCNEILDCSIPTRDVYVTDVLVYDTDPVTGFACEVRTFGGSGYTNNADSRYYDQVTKRETPELLAELGLGDDLLNFGNCYAQNLDDIVAGTGCIGTFSDGTFSLPVFFEGCQAIWTYQETTCRNFGLAVERLDHSPVSTGRTTAPFDVPELGLLSGDTIPTGVLIYEFFTSDSYTKFRDYWNGLDVRLTNFRTVNGVPERFGQARFIVSNTVECGSDGFTRPQFYFVHDHDAFTFNDTSEYAIVDFRQTAIDWTWGPEPGAECCERDYAVTTMQSQFRFLVDGVSRVDYFWIRYGARRNTSFTADGNLRFREFTYGILDSSCSYNLPAQTYTFEFDISDPISTWTLKKGDRATGTIIQQSTALDINSGFLPIASYYGLNTSYINPTDRCSANGFEGQPIYERMIPSQTPGVGQLRNTNFSTTRARSDVFKRVHIAVRDGDRLAAAGYPMVVQKEEIPAFNSITWDMSEYGGGTAEQFTSLPDIELRLEELLGLEVYRNEYYAVFYVEEQNNWTDLVFSRL